MKRYINRLMAGLGYVPAEPETFSLPRALATLSACAGTLSAAQRAIAPAKAKDATRAAFIAAAPSLLAAAGRRFVLDPFAPTFELIPDGEAVTIKMYPRAGSVQYLINVTGPRSSAVKFEGALPKLVQVSSVVESPP